MEKGLEREGRRFYRKDSQIDFSSYWDGGEHYASRNRWCFECAWECANKGKFCSEIFNKSGVVMYVGPICFGT